MPPANYIERTCETCGTTFVARASQIVKGTARFCSEACSANRPRTSTKVERVCEVCGEQFLTKQSEVQRGGGKYCSRECYGVGRPIPPGRQFLRGVGEPTETGCVLWTGCVRANGYGIIQHRPPDAEPQIFTAHRFAFELAHGPIPENLHVLHDCDRFYEPGDITYRRCVNPFHLFLGTAAENMADMVAKGRQTKGESCNLSKLTADQVRAIRAAYRPRVVSYQQLAGQYGVSVANVISIIKRRSWKHLS